LTTEVIRMPGSTTYLAVFIASLPAIVTSSSIFKFWSPTAVPLAKALHQLIPNNEPKRKPWAICYGGASNITDITSNITSDSTVEDSLIFQASKPGDGSESDPDGIPDRFLRMQKGNRPKAKQSFEETVKWREENGVNHILSRPHTKFDVCRHIFPVYIPGRDVHGNLIIVQRPGLLDVDALKKNNITTNEVILHYIYVVEYCWHILDPGPPDRKMTVILDLENLSFQTLRNSERRKFGMTFVKTMSDHYPQRSFKTLVINAPSWFETMYKIVKPLLRDSTKKKITIVKKGPQQDATLIEVLGIESVPREILHNPNCIGDRDVNLEPGANSSIEKELKLFCTERIKKFEEVMQSPV